MFLTKLSILIYHRVLREPDGMRPYEVDAATFQRHMKQLGRLFRVIPLSTALDELRNDHLPRGSVAITFDDGYADNASVAMPILKRLGLTATFFVASDYLDGGRMWNDTITEAVRSHKHELLDLRAIGLQTYSTECVADKYHASQTIIAALKYLPQNVRQAKVREIADLIGNDLPDDLMMTNEQVRELSSNGMSIGGHTASHPILATIDDETAYREISKNKHVLQDICEHPIDLFAYPNGKPNVDYKSKHVEMLKKLNFKAAVSTEWGTATKENDIYQLPRFTPWDHGSTTYLLRLLKQRWSSC
ncbi:MAG: polysaccharide deacetylase family protein [Gammaproteobacteria bacterium]|nr:polysaccharide deacetylase family protein [Gammaproteobacteria bacterium]